MKKLASTLLILGAVAFGASFLFVDNSITELACGFGDSGACGRIGAHRVFLGLGVVLLLVGLFFFVVSGRKSAQR